VNPAIAVEAKGTFMQLPETITRLYDHDGPFASVYLYATRASAEGDAEIHLRWRGLRGKLVEQGADGKTLSALDELADGTWELGGPRGRMLVAAAGQVLLAEETDRPPVREVARWSPLPDTLPYLVNRITRIPYLLVQIDRTGADITTVLDEHDRRKFSVNGDTQHPLRKTGRDDWSERHFQNRVENAWESNSKEVAQEIHRRRPLSVQLILIAGDVRARAMVSDHLAKLLPPSVTIEQLESGGRAEGISQSALDAAVHDALLRQVWRIRRDGLARLEQAIGRHDYAVTGVTAVVEALRKAQVETLVLSDDPSSTLTAFVGPGPLDLALEESELKASGVEHIQQDRLDAAIVRALAGTGAGIIITPGGHDYLRDGVAAMLRYTDESTPH